MSKRTSCILTVDDDPAIHRMMERVLRQEGHAVLAALSGEEALEMVQERMIDLILLDLSMPGMDGLETAARLKASEESSRIPILLFTARDSPANHAQAMDAGVDDFVSKTANPAVIKARVRSHLRLKSLNDRMHEHRQQLEAQVARQTRRLREASLETIVKLSAASEHRDPETGTHIQRMSRYAAAIARTMGLEKKTVEVILYSAPMHDIGKIGIPDRILLKPGPLNALEWRIMKTHPEIGAKILRDGRSNFLKMAETIAMTHHERWDGSGYPRGLKGNQIPLAGQIAAAADAFDALTSVRPYKDAVSGVEAIRIIQEGRGSHFAPKVVDALFGCLDEILAIRERFTGPGQEARALVKQSAPAVVRPPRQDFPARPAQPRGDSRNLHERPPQPARLSQRLRSWLLPGGAS